jgi:MFS family permease
MTVQQEWRDGWRLVPAAAAGMMTIAAQAYSFGAFVGPLHAEFGWNRAQLAVGISISGVISASTSALVGYAADRLGSRRIALWGTPIYCLAVAAFSQMGPSIDSYWTLYVVMAFASLMCSALIWTRAVVSRFVESRGIALSLTMCGTTVAGIFSPLIATFLIVHWGWRVAYIGLAIILLVITFPLVLAFFYDARDLRESNESKPLPTALQSPQPDLGGMTAAETLRTPGFWLLASSSLLSGAAVTTIPVHLIPLLQDRGVAPMQAAAGMSLVSLTAIAGRLGSGYFLDRISAVWVAAVTFSLGIVACMILLAGVTQTSLTLATSALFGFGLGSALTVMPYVTARCFGVKAYGTIYGLIYGAFIVGAAALPPVVGQLYERQGNYHDALIVWAATFFLAVTTLAFLKVPSRAATSEVLREVPS